MPLPPPRNACGQGKRAIRTSQGEVVCPSQKGGATGKCTLCPCTKFTLITDAEEKKIRDILTIVVKQNGEKKRRFNQAFNFDIMQQMKNQGAQIPEETNIAILSQRLAEQRVRCDNCVFSGIPGTTTLLDHLQKNTINRIVNGTPMNIPLGSHKYIPNYDDVADSTECVREGCVTHPFSAHAPKQTGGARKTRKVRKSTGTKVPKALKRKQKGGAYEVFPTETQAICGTGEVIGYNREIKQFQCVPADQASTCNGDDINMFDGEEWSCKSRGYIQTGGARKTRKSNSPVKGTLIRKATKGTKALKAPKVVRHRSTKKRAVRRSSPKGSLTVSVSKVMKSKRFTLACRGHSRIRGGLNSADIMRIAKRLKVSTRGTRVEVLRRICKKYGKKVSWTTVSAPKGKARHLLKYHCGAKCFLMPKEEKFPICPDYTVSRKCKPSCRGLLAAKRRASEWHYAGVRSKAVAMMKRLKCKSKSKSKSKTRRVAGTKLMK